MAADTASQFALPVLVQLPASPWHLLGLHLYNSPTATPRERLLTDHVDRQPLAAIEGPAEVSPAQELQNLEGEDGPFFWRHVWVGGRVRADPDGDLVEVMMCP